jgi:hypothetical protein
VVVDRDRQHFFGSLLADDVLVENGFDFMRLRQLVPAALRSLVELLANDVVAKLDALVADEDGRSGNELANLVLTLAAERAL